MISGVSQYALAVPSLSTSMLEMEREALCIRLLTTDGRVISRLHREGNRRSVGLEMTTLARDVVHSGARYILMEHNHPSGDPRPSDRDIDTTRQIWRLARTLGAALWDHIIICHDTQFSFRANGLL